jgi:vacuolar-type H+-ATPase subunit E/Vma4
MNQNINELLEGVELYIDNIKEKNKNDKVADDILPKIQEIHKQLGELDISVKASKENVINADVERWKKIWSEYGQNKEFCVKDISNSDVNNPEEFCSWIEKMANNQTVAENNEMFVEFWKNHIIENITSNIKSDVLELYKEHLSQYIDTVPEINASNTEEIEKNFISSKQFKKFNEIVLCTLTEGLKLGTIKSNDYDEIVEKFGIKATEEDINKLVAEEIPAKPNDIPPAGKKYTWDAKAKLWVLTDAV